MIPNKVKNIFAFIDFLERNKKTYIKTYIPLINRVLELSDERNKLNPSKNYKCKQQYDLIQKEIDEKFPLIKTNVVKPIQNKLLKFKIWDGDEIYTSIYNNNIDAISELKKDFTNADIEEIKRYKQRYLSFRSESNSNFLSLSLVFDRLDELLQVLFDFFKDTDKNEFEPFETKTIQVNSIHEIGELLRNGHTKFTLPIDYMNPSRIENIDLQIERLQQLAAPEKSKISEKIEKGPAAPVIKRFCELVNDSQLVERGIDESSEAFCERVCSKYGLRYRKRVSKYFTFNNMPKGNDASLKKVIERILPNIPEADKRQIEGYINNNTKLYG